MRDDTDPAAAASAVSAVHGDDPAALIEILHHLQDRLGWIPEAALPALARALNLSKAEVHGVVSFCHDFRREPPAGLVVKLCRAEACRSMGAEALEAALRDGAPEGLTVEPVYCLGNCALAPAALVDGRPVGRADPGRIARAAAAARGASA